MRKNFLRLEVAANGVNSYWNIHGERETNPERSHSWPSARAWKARMPQGIAGSNPALSAKNHISKNQGWKPRRKAPRHGIFPQFERHF